MSGRDRLGVIGLVDSVHQLVSDILADLGIGRLCLPNNPQLKSHEARMETLPVEVGALGGVLAHYSMIHTPPGEPPALLAEQARVLAPGGLLLASFFATDASEPIHFDHKVTPAYSWPATGSPSCWPEPGSSHSPGCSTTRPPSGASSTPTCLA